MFVYHPCIWRLVLDWPYIIHSLASAAFTVIDALECAGG